MGNTTSAGALTVPCNAGLQETAAQRRARLFRETPLETARRWALGTAYALMPNRITSVPSLLWWCAIDLIGGGTRVPDAGHIRCRPDSFGGVCRKISPATILEAARRGFFPWCHFGPLKWWTRSQRMVLFLNEHHISRRLRREMRKTPYRVTFDRAFDDVIKACAAPRSTRKYKLTWITPQIMRLYAALHDQGHAHSFEVWNQNGDLVGGGYGLAAGRVFFTESQFSMEKNTSKIGFAVLNFHLAKWGFVLNDGKDYTPAIDAMGFRHIPRHEFERVLRQHSGTYDLPGAWVAEANPAAVAAWEPNTVSG